VSDAVAAAQARALGSPSRRAIVTYLTRSDAPVSVAELTDHLGLNHNAIRKHLAQLVAAELVVEEHERRSTAGRPRLVYRLAPRTAAAGEQSYRRLAVLLAEAMVSGEDPALVGRRAAVASSPAAGGIDTLAALFAADGFEPTLRSKAGVQQIVLGRCPFADAAAANPEVVCRLHLGLAKGYAQSVGGVRVDELVPRDPYRAGCLVSVRPVV
jgi:predicted ArsR family transcriptional regulator